MRNQGVGTWIHRRRVKSAGKTALISSGAELSYPEFAERVDRLASAFADRGIAKGGRVAYLGENHAAFLETFFACGTLGAVFVPLNTRLAPPEIEFALQDSGSSILVHARSLEGLAVPGSRGTALTHRIVVADTPTAADTGAGTAADTAAGTAVVEDFEHVIASGSA